MIKANEIINRYFITEPWGGRHYYMPLTFHNPQQDGGRCDCKFWNIGHNEFMGYGEVMLKDLRGIPLTPEILEKCGMNQCSENESCASIGLDWDKSYITPFARKRLALAFDDNGPGQINTYWIENVGMSEVLLTYDIKYLHQLQNLYYILFDEELPVNL